jgi:hypothetical protein
MSRPWRGAAWWRTAKHPKAMAETMAPVMAVWRVDEVEKSSGSRIGRAKASLVENHS